jgi:hypothetical protein
VAGYLIWYTEIRNTGVFLIYLYTVYPIALAYIIGESYFIGLSNVPYPLNNFEIVIQLEWKF